MIILVQVINDEIRLIESYGYEINEWSGFTLRDENNEKIIFDDYNKALKWVSENIKPSYLDKDLKQKLMNENLYDFREDSQKFMNK